MQYKIMKLILESAENAADDAGVSIERRHQDTPGGSFAVNIAVAKKGYVGLSLAVLLSRLA